MTEKTHYYPQLEPKLDFPAMEQNLIRYWQENKTFEKSVNNRQNADEFVFYDGPPFANGLPHYGHIFISYVKDTVARFQTMLGKRVERRLGWDCHGLPAEMSAEQQLGVSGHKAIEAYGIDKFNAFCRQDVLKYTNVFRDLFLRIGRWVDFDNDYRTMDLPFMESVLHNFKELYDKGLIYEGYRVQPYSWAAQTTVSNFEVAQNYRDKTDTAVTVMFKLEDGRYVLIWTTTPWTLPSNLMIAVGADMDYAVMEENGTQYILAEALKGRYKQQLQNATQVGTVKGSDLVGLSYEPLFPYFAHLKEKGCFKILAGNFVSTEDGTGLVHIAPGFGAEDFDACMAISPDFPVACPVDEAGCFTSEVPDYVGKQVFETNEPIIARLKQEGKLVKKEQITHSYPFCWRTDTPLIYKAMSSWFVKVTDFKDEMLQNNHQIHWIPDNVKQGRFGKGLETAPDWNISRNRFWGTPLPVWQSDNPAFPRTDVFGSVAEIKEKTGFDVQDLHRPMIDQVVYPNPDDPSGQTMMRRVPYVFDCWFESGSMPEGQIHYPFDKKEWFADHFPADFIVEGIDQTRGWFYSLHVLGTALHHKPAYKTCMATGLLMGDNGQKLSKKLKNYPDPYKILNSFGSDALRLCLISSQAVKAGNAFVDDKEIAKTARKLLLPFWNAYYFFCLYANAEGVKAEEAFSSADVLDKYILAKLKKLVVGLRQQMQDYDISRACNECADFLDILNNWYIRRSRARFWDGTDQAAFNTLYTVLLFLSKLMAPLMPFIAEFVYQGLTNGESVHLLDYPVADNLIGDDELVETMDLVRVICSTAKSVREAYKLRNRLPLASMQIAGVPEARVAHLLDIIQDEINVKQISCVEDLSALANQFLYVKTPLVGKRLGAHMKDILTATKANQWSLQEDGTLSIAGQVLFPEEFELHLEMKEGVTGMALPDNTAVIQLDTTVYPALEQEGIARDFVRLVQQARKNAGLDVSDRIELRYTSNLPTIDEAIHAHESYILDQVLAQNISRVDSLDAPQDELGEGWVRIAVSALK